MHIVIHTALRIKFYTLVSRQDNNVQKSFGCNFPKHLLRRKLRQKADGKDFRRGVGEGAFRETLGKGARLRETHRSWRVHIRVTLLIVVLFSVLFGTNNSFVISDSTSL